MDTTPPELVKQCPGCLKLVPVSAYSFKCKRTSKRRSRCKACTDARGGAWRALNPTYAAQWRANHPDYMRDYARARRKRDPA